MKIDLELISAALDAVLKENRVARFGAIPLRTLAEHWESVRLRSSDLVSGIEILSVQGRLDLEARSDGLWVRRKSRASGDVGAYDKLRSSVHELVMSVALTRVRMRQGDGYSGFDRRLPHRTA